MIKQLVANKVVKNASWIVFGRVMQMIIALFANLLTARYLGPAKYGLLNYANAYISFFLSLCTLGINSVIVAELVKNRDKEGEILGTALGLRAVASFFSAIAIICIVNVVDNKEPTTIAVVALTSIGVLFNVLEVFKFWFQSKLKSRVTAICLLVAYFFTAIYKVVLIFIGKNVVWFAFANSVDYIILGALLFFAYIKNKGAKLHFSAKYAKTLFGKSYHFILSGLMVAIYGQTDKLMLKQMVNAEEIGFYSTAVSVCTMWCFVLQAIIDSMYPSIIESHGKNQENFEKKNKILYAIIFYISVVVSIGMSLFAEFIITILYGSEYLSSAESLRIITWYTAFSYLGVARSAWLVSYNCQKYLVFINAGAAVINVILNLVLIPKFGAPGAAFASLIAQISTITLPLFVKDLRRNTILIFDAISLKWLFKSVKRNS